MATVLLWSFPRMSLVEKLLTDDSGSEDLHQEVYAVDGLGNGLGNGGGQAPAADSNMADVTINSSTALLEVQPVPAAAIEGHAGRSSTVWCRLVASAVFIDSMLLSVVIPILPSYLSELGVAQSAIGVLFASKAVAQVCTSPFSAAVSDRLGKQGTMLLGMAIIVVSTLVFAVGTNYGTLLAARASQGIGSSFTATAGFSLIASLHRGDEKAQGEAMGVVTAGIGFGVILGPPFGGLCYHFRGKELAFLVLAGLAVLNLGGQVAMLRGPRARRLTSIDDPDDLDAAGEPAPKPKSMFRLVQDPAVLGIVFSLMMATTGISFLEPTLPLWMEDKFDSPAWETGVVFLAASLAYLIGVPIGSCWNTKSRDKLSAVAMVLIAAGAAFVAVPGERRYAGESVPGLILVGVGLGMCESTMNPLLASTIDERHPGSQAAAFALIDMAASVAFAVGPVLGSVLYTHLDYRYVCLIEAGLILAAAPLIVWTRPRNADAIYE